jgi:hypothetical protein
MPVSRVIVDEGEFPALAALVLADVLIPERKLHGVYSRTTLWKMRKDGLPSYKVPNLGTCFRPSELKHYLECRALPIES